MAKKRGKQKISEAERARRRRQARINFGLTKKSSRSTKRKINKQMVKRRRKSVRRSGNLKPMQILIGGGIYGAARAYLSNVLRPVTSKIPLGSIADEVVLFGAGYFANKNFRDKTLKSVSTAAMTVEAARIGEAVLDGSAFNNVPSSSGAGLSGVPTLG